METIKFFVGMEIGRYDGYEYGKVLKTYPNGTKLVWFDHEDADEADSWDELWIVQEDEDFGWYGIDSQNIRVAFDDFMERKSRRDFRAEFDI